MKKLSVLLVVGLVLGLSIGVFANAGSKVVVSDGSETNAVLAWTHPNWTANIPGAEWIWSSEYAETPETGSTETFSESFNLNGVPAGATLYIAADNQYEVSLNGVSVASGSGYSNADVYTIGKSDLKPGRNVLEVTGINNPGSSDPESNPAGVIYKLVVDYDKGGCNNGVGNGSEDCTPGNAPENDEGEDTGPGNPGNKGGA